MSFTDFIKDSVLEMLANNAISIKKILITLGVAYVLAMYIHMVYKFITKNAFYNKNYGVSMVITAVVTASIVMAMQTNLAISLGMVGALSIVRFRTAIKDPLDLMFLFWSIGLGIICGAGLYELAVITSVVATIGIIVFELLPIKKASFILAINATDRNAEGKICKTLNGNPAIAYKVRSKNVTRDGMDMIIELKMKAKSNELVEALLAFDEVSSVSLLDNSAR